MFLSIFFVCSVLKRHFFHKKALLKNLHPQEQGSHKEKTTPVSDVFDYEDNQKNESTLIALNIKISSSVRIKPASKIEFRFKHSMASSIEYYSRQDMLLFVQNLYRDSYI